MSITPISQGGYSAGYSYKWAEVLDADAFLNFFNKVANKFKDNILKRHPMILYKRFRGHNSMRY
jgi:peptidyl-dipeptidase Dcp